jgi:hypothetical protein
MSFKVADRRAVTMIAPPSPVVDADNRGGREDPRSEPTHHAQQRVVAYVNVEPMGKGCSRAASKRDGEAVDDIVEAACSPRSRLDRLEPFGKDPSNAGLGVAEEAACP